MIPSNETIIDLLRQLEALLAEHTHLSVDDPLVVARDGLLLLVDHPCSDTVQGYVIEFAQCVLLVTRPIEVTA